LTKLSIHEFFSVAHNKDPISLEDKSSRFELDGTEKNLAIERLFL